MLVVNSTQHDSVEIITTAVPAYQVVFVIALVDIGPLLAGVESLRWEVGFIVGIDFRDFGQQLLDGACNHYVGAAWSYGDGPNLLLDVMVW